MDLNAMINGMTDINTRTEKFRQQNAAQEQKEKDAVNASYDAQEADTNNVYNKAIGDTKVQYEQDYERNAVQKLINERQIAETNANLGLTDSGLNRTQQTAAQLSYANQKGKLDLAKQSALDNLSLNLASAISTLKQNRQSDLLNIENKWLENAQTQAQNEYNTEYTNLANMYNSWLEQQTAIQKAQIEAAAKVSSAKNADNSEGSNGSILYTQLKDTYEYDKNGNRCRVYYGTDGNTYLAKEGQNPYTNTDNSNSASAKDWGFFKNGYQPKGLSGIGELKYTYDKLTLTGKEQNVFYTEDSKGKKRYWLWIGNKNAYQEFMYESVEDKYYPTDNYFYIK